MVEPARRVSDNGGGGGNGRHGEPGGVLRCGVIAAGLVGFWRRAADWSGELGIEEEIGETSWGKPERRRKPSKFSVLGKVRDN